MEQNLQNSILYLLKIYPYLLGFSRIAFSQSCLSAFFKIALPLLRGPPLGERSTLTGPCQSPVPPVYNAGLGDSPPQQPPCDDKCPCRPARSLIQVTGMARDVASRIAHGLRHGISIRNRVGLYSERQFPNPYY
jgi:hypothetical protein